MSIIIHQFKIFYTLHCQLELVINIPFNLILVKSIKFIICGSIVIEYTISA